MKRLLVILVAVGLFGAMPVLAAEHDKHENKSAECIKACALQTESLQEKIDRIQKEIEDGSQKYSPEELKKLQRILEDANKTLDEMYKR